MNKTKFLITLALLAAAPALVAKPRAVRRGGETITALPEGQRELEAAMAQARRGMPGFLALLANPPAGTSDYMVRYPLTRQDQVWVGELTREGPVLIGTLLSQPPGKLHTKGERLRMPIARVSDWGYRDADGVVQGNYTDRALLAFMPKDLAAQLRHQLGWDRVPAK